ncbi:anti-sigma factor antagonist [Streptomyces aurantiacus]|uniref:anti-sigma factor antagonist n=1 Tax=Streptomyces aurantiacus TaxID=47760 RepID=UPI003CCC4508
MEIENWAARQGEKFADVQIDPEEIEEALRSVKRQAQDDSLQISAPIIDGYELGQLAVSTRFVPGFAIVELGGEIDVYTSPFLREALADLVMQGQYRHIIDFSRLDFLDSTGLNVIVADLKAVRKHGGQVLLVCHNVRSQEILKILRITNLVNIFPVYGTVDEAVAAGSET